MKKNPSTKKKHNPSISWCNTPNKDIANQIHKSCFDYKNMNKKVMGQKIEERVYVAYNGVFMVIKDWITDDEQDFLNFVKKMKIDKTII